MAAIWALIFITMSALAGPGQKNQCALYAASAHDQLDELVKCLTEKAKISSADGIEDPFYFEPACFSENRDKADKCTNPAWLNSSMLERAKFVYLKYEELVAWHELKISPRGLTCKALRESCFRPQDVAPGKQSSAAGLSQVTKSTAADLFNRDEWFKSAVTEFTKIKDGKVFYQKMKASIVAQLELGLAVFQQKVRDNGFTTVFSTLKAYYGNPKDSENTKYSNSILKCAKCLEKNGITEACLKDARRSCFN